MKDLGVPIKDPIPLYIDNMTSIYLARNPVFHAHSKHIEVHYHSNRERVRTSNVDLQHISMNLQTVDIFTKPLGVDKLLQVMSDLVLAFLDLPSLRGSTQLTRTRTEVNSE